jgi:hypothetical protein
VLNEFINFVRDGEPVAAGVTNRPTQQLQQNINYLWEVLSASGLGSTIVIRRATVDASVKVGQPVYFSSSSKVFEQALATVATGTVDGHIVAAESAQVWGVVLQKLSSTLADILVSGYSALNLSEAVTGTVTAGLYYLSGSTPGKLVNTRTPVTIPVLRADGNGNVLVLPQFADFIDRHVHYKFDLVCQPAGAYTEPASGDPHVITLADSTLPGWLPAGDPIFSGKAPAGAVFGYNLSVHTALQNVWPPIPTTEAYLEWDRGNATGSNGISLGAAEACIIDRNGIWWMSDCYGDVPWPTAYNSPGFSVSLSDPPDAECPRRQQMSMRVWFTKPSFATDATVVTSLTALDPRLIVTCVDGTPASVGALSIDLDLDFVSTTGNTGYQVLKEIDGNSFKQGPVCEGLYTSSSTVTLSSPSRRRLTVGNSSSPWLYQGPVEISVVPTEAREVEVQLIRLDGVEEQFYEDVTYLGFPAASETSVRCKLHVPSSTGFVSPTIALKLRILGRAAGTLPTLTVTARRLPKPSSGSSVALPLTASEFAVSITTTATLGASNRYIEVTSTAFAVVDGDTLLFTVQRGSGDAYAGEIGILQRTGIISAA